MNSAMFLMRAGNDRIAHSVPIVRLGTLPTIKLATIRPPSATEIAYIKNLIRQLVHIDRLDYGQSPYMSGPSFAPILVSESASRMQIANHGRQSNQLFLELVRLGPRALPFLLEALDDSTPTKLIVKREGIVNMIELSNEMDSNPANVHEWNIVSGISQSKKEVNALFNAPSHVVTIGDVCFVIIGQIVGRNYLSVRYQPSGIYVVNSPTRDSSLTRAVRTVWSSDDPAQHLLDSLLLDYVTRGIHRGGKDSGLDDWDVGSTLQISATMRLLFYFPLQTIPLISSRLNRLQIQSTDLDTGPKYSETDMTRWMKRELANEVRTKDFLKAVVWSREPEIQASLRSIFQKTSDPEILLGTLSALDSSRHWSLVERHFRTLFCCLPRSERGCFGIGYTALVALRELGGDKARSLYREYLHQASAQRCFSLCAALRDKRGEWDREFLWPMLSDKRTSLSYGYDYPVKPNASSPRLPIRVCDSAAEIIALHRKDIQFKMVGTVSELDRQIRMMQGRLVD